MTVAANAANRFQVNRCACGCNGMTDRSFVPGHDARHKSELFRKLWNETAAPDRAAFDELVRRNWLPYRSLETKFGVEIEFVSRHSMDYVASTLTSYGVKTEQRGYTHSVISNWKIVPDRSVTGTNGRRGMELVSPILEGTDGLFQLYKACWVLTHVLKASVNKSCGLHVHHNCAGMKAWQIAATVLFYDDHAPVMDVFLAPSRRDGRNGYCRRLDNTSKTRFAQMILNNTNNESFSYWDRYRSVNVVAFALYGTLEFRQHHGTIDPARIASWIIFTRQIISYTQSEGYITRLRNNVDGFLAAQRSDSYYDTATRTVTGTYPTVKTLLEATIQDKATRRMMMARATALSKKGTATEVQQCATRLQ